MRRGPVTPRRGIIYGGIQWRGKAFDTNMTLAAEILSQLSLADKTAAWGTLGTVKPHPGFEAGLDVEDLAEAMAGKGVHKDIIVNIIAGRNNAQRQQIVNLFRNLVNEDLVKVLEGALSGHLKELIVGLLKSPAQYDAHQLKSAMKGLGTDEDLMTEILSTRTSEQLREMRTVYKEDFKSDLENDIAQETSGDFKELLFALMKGVREKNTGIIDYVQIDQDAQALSDFTKNSNRISGQWISIMSGRNYDHLLRVFQQYKKYSSSEVEGSIQKHFKGDFQKALLSLVSVIRNTPLYFADKLHKSMKGLGTKEDTLNRILISRSEIDLLSIRADFRKTYGKSLYSYIQSDTKGDYQTALLALCRGEDL